MLRIWRPSGQELAAISADEFPNTFAVKEHLREAHGLPMCVQQLLQDGGILADDTAVDTGMDLQLVLLQV